MHDLLEIAFAQAEQRRAVHLGIAADIIMQPRLEGLAVAGDPGLVDLVFGVDEHRLGIPVIHLARQIVAAFQDQDPLARGGQPLRQRRSAGAAADDDQVVVEFRQ